MAPAPQRKKHFRSVSLIWLLPNMLTVAGLVSGLTALRFALDGRWEGTIGLIGWRLCSMRWTAARQDG